MFSAKKGRMGMMMPKPTMLTNMMRKRIPCRYAIPLESSPVESGADGGMDGLGGDDMTQATF
jgi:hypothetical protein